MNTITSRRRLLTVATSATGGMVLLSGRRPTQSSSVLRYAPSVPDSIRDKAERAKRRVETMLDLELQSPVTVKIAEGAPFSHDTGDPLDRFGQIKNTAVHASRADDPPDEVGPSGMFLYDERTMLLTSPPVDESTIAHELVHALQGERFDSLDPPNRTVDGRRTRHAIVEGTAQYIQTRYWMNCSDGEYGHCDIEEPAFQNGIPRWILPRNSIAIPVGIAFVHTLYERAGWAGVWEAHRSFPPHTAAIMFSQLYLNGPFDPESVPSPTIYGDNWVEIDASRIGVTGLYAKLRLLGAASPTAVSDVDESLAELARRTGIQTLPGDARLADWRGDRLTGYGHLDNLDRQAYRWDTAWASETAAGRIATAVTEQYDASAHRDADRWVLDGLVVDIHHADNIVTFTMAPTHDDHDALFDPDGTQ
ncbi:hypothetical protein [Natranaeroarchaeum aerophilus]|uniref:DUF4157 domain-containing protein n=1 Tax=Natranaeroarchaeum aerophilus TaxID=2917711 RepID=A0AAE3K374_9EURY|nr:hypothetical protein [Natranaeroarchaeum aerophilus]MCL9812293.1 hypothetical protein [Natranaeroarchaeum aerophilus]